MFNILSQITLKVKFLSNEEQHCLLPSLVDDFTCVRSKNALLTHILSTLFSSTSVLFSCAPFGTKSINCMIMCILTWVGGGRGGLVYSVSLLTYVVGDEHIGIWWLAQWRLIQIRDELNIYVWIKQTHKAWSKSAPTQREHVHWLLQLLDIFWFMQREPK